MTIAILIPTFEIGGAENIALKVAKLYADNGHKIIFFLYRKSRNKSFNCDYEHVYIEFDYGGMTESRRLKKIIDSAKRTKQKKKELNVDLSISFMELCNQINCFSRANDKIIVSVRTTLSARTEYNSVEYKKMLIRYSYNRADRVVSVSEYTKNDLIRNYGVHKNSIVTIPNPARKPLFDSNKKWKWGDKVILHIGRLDPVKQQDRLIRAFSLVYKIDNDARLILLGDGKLRKYLEMIARKMGVQDAVIMPGFTDEVGFFLENSKALVLCSRAEGFPNSIVEAMAYGVPVISTDSPGGCIEILGYERKKSEYYINCEYGIKVPYMKGKAPRGDLDKNEKCLAEAMLELIDNARTQDYYKTRSLIRSQDYSENQFFEAWLNLLRVKKGY